MSLVLKKAITKELHAAGLAGRVDAAAITLLAGFFENSYGGHLDALPDVLKLCQADASLSGKLGVEHVQTALSKLQGTEQQVEAVEVISAFHVPRITFDLVAKRILIDPRSKPLLGTAEAKHRLYLERLHLLQQRLSRNRLFQQSHMVLHSSAREAGAQLCDVASLRGVPGVTRYVLGALSAGEGGGLVLEDAGGCVPIDVSGAVTAAGFYTEGCVVIAEGELRTDGAFHARALGFPPAEPRSELPMAAQKLNLFGGRDISDEVAATLEAEETQRGPNDRMVVLANVWLDQPDVMDNLHNVFRVFSGVSIVPSMFVLMGSFHSRAGSSSGSSASASSYSSAAGGSGRGGAGAGAGGVAGGSAAGEVSMGVMRELYTQLAHLIDQYPRIKAESRFVFVPGPGDLGTGSVLPQPPIPALLTKELRRLLPNAVFATNPCRIRYCTQQLVLFRQDLLKRLRRKALMPVQGAEDMSAKTAWGHLALTLLQQSHLCPLPLLAQPIFWHHDTGLSLYPLPHALLLADASPAQEFTHLGCKVVNPGSFALGSFTCYLPCSQHAEPSELPRAGATQATQQDAWEDEEAAPSGTGAEDEGAHMQEGELAGPDLRAFDACEEQHAMERAHAQRFGGGGNGAGRFHGAADADADVIDAVSGDGQQVEEGEEDGIDLDLGHLRAILQGGGGGGAPAALAGAMAGDGDGDGADVSSSQCHMETMIEGDEGDGSGEGGSLGNDDEGVDAGGVGMGAGSSTPGDELHLLSALALAGASLATTQPGSSARKVLRPGGSEEDDTAMQLDV